MTLELKVGALIKLVLEMKVEVLIMVTVEFR